MHHDPFATLGIPRTASVAQVRTAFRRQALRHHPDRNLGDPLANDRFKRILRAYRVALARATHGPDASGPPPVGPRPDRYECARCGDCFPFREPCPRCGVALWDRSVGPAVRRDPPEVTALIAQLEARPVVEGPTWAERLPVPGLLVSGCLAAGAFAYQVGPVGVALLFAGFSAYVTALELHRRATAAVTA